MEFAGTVSAEFKEDCYYIGIEGGEDDGLLIGRGGETLDAIQHVVLKMAGRTEEGVQIKVDISGYRSRREDQLADKAREIARQVLETGRGVTVGPYKAAERRIVHRAVAEVEGVTTRALGDGLMKRILIEAGSSSRVEEGESVPRVRAASLGDEPAPRRHERRPSSGTYGEDRERSEASRDESPAERGGEPVDRLNALAAIPDLKAKPQPKPQPNPAAAESGATTDEWGRKPKVSRGMNKRR